MKKSFFLLCLSLIFFIIFNCGRFDVLTESEYANLAEDNSKTQNTVNMYDYLLEDGSVKHVYQNKSMDKYKIENLEGDYIISLVFQEDTVDAVIDIYNETGILLRHWDSHTAPQESGRLKELLGTYYIWVSNKANSAGNLYHLCVVKIHIGSTGGACFGAPSLNDYEFSMPMGHFSSKVMLDSTEHHYFSRTAGEFESDTQYYFFVMPFNTYIDFIVGITNEDYNTAFAVENYRDAGKAEAFYCALADGKAVVQVYDSSNSQHGYYIFGWGLDD